MPLTNVFRLTAKRSTVPRHLSFIDSTVLKSSVTELYTDRQPRQKQHQEYTKSGTDDGAAKQEEAAFDPSKTSPEEEKGHCWKGKQGQSFLAIH